MRPLDFARGDRMVAISFFDTPSYPQGKNRLSEKRGKQQQFKHVEYRCANCGALIEDYFNGKDTVPAAALAKRSWDRFGRVLCIKCGKAEEK